MKLEHHHGDIHKPAGNTQPSDTLIPLIFALTFIVVVEVAIAITEELGGVVVIVKPEAEYDTADANENEAKNVHVDEHGVPFVN